MNCTHGIDVTTTRCALCDLIKITAERDALRESFFRDLVNDSDSPVGSCSCLTMSPDILFHKRGCRYRLIVERDTLRAEKETTRAKMLASLQKEMEEQLFLAAEQGKIGVARLGGDRRKMVELQMEWLRNCAQNWQNPAAFMLHWMRMMVVGLLVYENLIEMQEAVKDVTETNQDKPNEH